VEFLQLAKISSNLESHPTLILIIATLAVGPAAILVRFALENDAALIAFYRVLIVGVISVSIAKITGEKNILPRNSKEAGLILLAGLSLGCHFVLWFESLRYAPVAVSVLLVTTTPIWMTVAALIFLGIPPTRNESISIGLVFVAISIMVLQINQEAELVLDENLAFGGFLAISASWLVVVYFFIAKKMLRTRSLWGYFGLVNLFAAMFLACYLLLTSREFTAATPSDYIVFLLLALGPSLIGHAGYNYSMKLVRPHEVGFAILGEPIIASVLAVIIFSEIPSISTWIGGALLLTALYLVVVTNRDKTRVNSIQ